MARGQVVPRHRSHADLPPSPGLQRDVRLLILSHIEFAKPVFDGFLRDTVGQLATEVQRIRPWYVPDHGVARGTCGPGPWPGPIPAFGGARGVTLNIKYRILDINY